MDHKINTIEAKAHQCNSCCMTHKDKKYAEKCESWCKKHNSCNPKITCYPLENKEVQK